ncbi:MAG: DUF4167 domain-containing protein [Alphaproteobacteria bacterium]|nr:DUF4167 domain-containing protein [Alphaproteobacteria bacterium]
MQNGPRSNSNSRQQGRGRRWDSNGGGNGSRPRPQNNQNAQRSYERYMALAQAEIVAGDIVSAENYYQHAEHYLRSMSPDPEIT